MGPVKQYTGENVDDPLSVLIHPGADGNFSLYEDDGKTFNYRKGEFMQVNLTWNDRQRRLSLRLANGSRMLPPAKRNIVAHVVGTTERREMVFEGRPVDIRF
jgi:alpha-glucosidase (family GH31 glycosyl hydrolase)